MLKKLLLMVGLVFSPSYSYSETVTPYFGVTGNAATNGNTWSMDNVLPEPPGLDINTIIYNYTIQKDVDDSVNVHVQNENAAGTGYIFRETDEWNAGSLGGQEIRKVVPVIPNIPRAAWGDGSIETEGDVSVQDPTVLYSYKVDPCYDPQHSPLCPGYVTPIPDIPEIDVSTIYDATEDEYVSLSSEEKVTIEQNEETIEEIDEEAEEEEEKRKREYRLQALADTNAALLIAQDLQLFAMSNAMQTALNNTYLKTTIPGGVYEDNLKLVDRDIKDNNQGLRNGLAQQLLHEKMIDSQYN